MVSLTSFSSKTDIQDLPKDTDTLQNMLLIALAHIDDISGQLNYFKRHAFGKKSEKIDPNQMLLFESLLNELEGKQGNDTDAEEDTPKKKKKKKNSDHNGRNTFPDHLPTETIIIDISDEDKQCDICNTDKVRFGEEVTKKLEFSPATFYVKEYVRPKYGCPDCKSNITIGDLPPMTIDKGIAGDSLISHIVTSKYCDHLPLSRQQIIFKRSDIHIATSSMSDWVGYFAGLMQPLAERMRENILKSPVIFTDDTGLLYKDDNESYKVSQGYLWVYTDQSNVYFDFTPTRGARDGPHKILDGYQGYIQADAYAGYNKLYGTNKATEVGCNAHARRKFDYAIEQDPTRGCLMKGLWNRLYDIERKLNAKYREVPATPEEILLARQEKAVPILNDIKALLDKYKSEVLPKSLIGKAVTYALNQWDALCEYTKNPILSIDNNLAERIIRKIALGRNNYLYAGSIAGANRAAIIYSLVGSCKLNDVDPFAYFCDVLKRINTHPASKIDELLPENWKPQSQ